MANFHWFSLLLLVITLSLGAVAETNNPIPDNITPMPNAQQNQDPATNKAVDDIKMRLIVNTREIQDLQTQMMDMRRMINETDTSCKRGLEKLHTMISSILVKEKQREEEEAKEREKKLNELLVAAEATKKKPKIDEDCASECALYGYLFDYDSCYEDCLK